MAAIPTRDGVEFTRVASTNVEAIGYSPRKGRTTSCLWVRFNSGKTYGYLSVPETMFKTMLDSASKGSFVWNRLRFGTKDKRRSLYECIGPF